MHASPFQVRGVVEGFYGVYYTFPERNDLIRFLGQHGFNCYIYGPKNDRQHRARWWQPYPQEIMAQFAETVAIARAAGISFCYAITPTTYERADDLPRVAAKLRAFFDMGVRSFCVLMDDIFPASETEAGDKRAQHLAELHADLCNQLFAMLGLLSSDCTFAMCPVDYFGRAPFGNYLRALGELLNPAIDIFYTGPDICSPTIAEADARSFAEAVRRQPLIWDNYPVNDLAMRGELHIGPVRGRDPRLACAVKGLVANPMIQPEVSKIPLATLAEYLADPAGYDPDAAWKRALAKVGGQASYEPLHLFAETALHSCVEPADAPQLTALVAAAVECLEHDDLPGAVLRARGLEEYLERLDESCYHLKNRMTNLALRANLIPWIETLEDWIWLGKRSAQALAALERRQSTARLAPWIAESLQAIQTHNKRSGGAALLPLAQYVQARI
jgi:hyaluronoglucosaminidase